MTDQLTDFVPSGLAEMPADLVELPGIEPGTLCMPYQVAVLVTGG